MATIRVSLAIEAARLQSVLKPLVMIEAGMGADGVGHGRLKPPSEQLLHQEAQGSEEHEASSSDDHP